MYSIATHNNDISNVLISESYDNPSISIPQQSNNSIEYAAYQVSSLTHSPQHQHQHYTQARVLPSPSLSQLYSTDQYHQSIPTANDPNNSNNSFTNDSTQQHNVPQLVSQFSSNTADNGGNNLNHIMQHISDSAAYNQQQSNHNISGNDRMNENEVYANQLHQYMNGQQASSLSQYTQLPHNSVQYNTSNNNNNNTNKPYFDPLLINEYINNTPYNNASMQEQHQHHAPHQSPHLRYQSRPVGPVGMACLPCYNAKTSCSGDRPCHRCIRLGRAGDCNDRPHKRRRPRTSKQYSIDSSDDGSTSKPTNKSNQNKKSVKTDDNSNTSNIKHELQSSDDDTTDYSAYDGYDCTLEDEDDVAAENRIMSSVVLDLLIKLLPQLTQYLVKSKLPHVVTLNVIFSYFAQALQPSEFNELIAAMMSRQQLHDIITAADPDGQLVKRRYIWDYTDSPIAAFPDQPIVPNIATVLNTSLNIHPNRTSWDPQNSINNQQHNKSINNHSNNKQNTNNNNTSDGNTSNHNESRSNSPADIEYSTSGASSTGVQSTTKMHTSIDTDSYPPSNRAVIGSKAVVKSVPFSDVIDQVTVHSDAVDVDSMLNSLLRNPDTLLMKKCIVVNREFERVFGWSQEDIRNIHIRRNTMGMWSLSVGFHKYRQARSTAKIKQRMAATDQNKYKKLLHDASMNLKADMQRMWLEHHQASVQGITQFSQQVVMVTKHNVEIPCVMIVRYGHNQDGVTSTTSTQFIPIPPDDGVLR